MQQKFVIATWDNEVEKRYFIEKNFNKSFLQKNLSQKEIEL